MPLYITAVLVALRRPTQNRQMVLICGWSVDNIIYSYIIWYSFKRKHFFVAYFTQQNEIDVELKLSIGLLHAGWRIQVPLLKRPRFLANRTCAKHKSRYPFIWPKFVLKRGYPRDHSEFLKSVIFVFFPGVYMAVCERVIPNIPVLNGLLAACKRSRW